jgi:hypothetical protein
MGRENKEMTCKSGPGMATLLSKPTPYYKRVYKKIIM